MSLPRVSTAERQERAESRVGNIVGQRWRLDELLGIGGMASVYAATHRNGSHVALKLLHPELCEYPDLCERFLEEGHAANRVGPPGVVAVLDEGVAEDGALFLVMELLRGRTLEEWCALGARPSLGQTLRIADQVLCVLERAHAAGVVHRDIKPENVFITDDGEIKLLDFGIARMADSQRLHQTEPGSAVGTPAFMPPEQARGRRDAIDERTDLWALGATLFWTLSSKFVHEAATVNEELLLAMTVRARSLAVVAPQVPSELVRFVDRALEFDPENRYGSAREMRMALRRVLDDVDADALETRTGPTSTRSTLAARQPRPLGARLRTAAMAAGLSLLGGAGWAWLTPAGTEPASPLEPAAFAAEPDLPSRAPGDMDLLVAAPIGSASAVEAIPPSFAPSFAPSEKPKPKPPRRSAPAAKKREAPVLAPAPRVTTHPGTRDPLSRRK